MDENEVGERGKKMTLKSVVVTNKCSKPVYFKEGHNKEIPAGATTTFSSASSLQIQNRLSFAYDANLFKSGLAGLPFKMVFLEMAIDGWKLGSTINQGGFNFVAQDGFIDMTLEVIGWKDSPGGELVCEDARAKITYSMAGCGGLEDVKIEDHGTNKFCKSEIGSSCTSCQTAGPGCTSHYAMFVNQNSWLYSKAKQSWVQQSPSVGMAAKGFKQAKFADGTSAPSTGPGRAPPNVAVNFECWELPCLQNQPYCESKGYVSTGNVGFMFCPDVQDFSIGALQVVTCGSGSETGAAVGAQTQAKQQGGTAQMPTGSAQTQAQKHGGMPQTPLGGGSAQTPTQKQGKGIQAQGGVSRGARKGKGSQKKSG